MASIQFEIGDLGLFTVDINENEIWGGGHPDAVGRIVPYSWVTLPVKIQRSPSQGTAPKVGLLISLSGVAYLRRSPDLIAGWLTEKRPQGVSITDAGTNFELQLPLTDIQIEAIETYRNTKDLNMPIDITCTVALYGEGRVVGIQNVTKSGILKIPRSRWTDYVLPYTSYHCVKVIEIPIPEEPTAQLFIKACEALKHAQEHYSKDYITCIEETRKALQPIIDSVKKKDMAEAGTKVNGGEKLRWYAKSNLAPIIGENWANNIGNILVSLWSMTSKHHHESPYTPRHDATLAIHLSSALISYIGHVTGIKQNRQF
jgi:hypothetical protein